MTKLSVIAAVVQSCKGTEREGRACSLEACALSTLPGTGTEHCFDRIPKCQNCVKLGSSCVSSRYCNEHIFGIRLRDLVLSESHPHLQMHTHLSLKPGGRFRDEGSVRRHRRTFRQVGPSIYFPSVVLVGPEFRRFGRYRASIALERCSRSFTVVFSASLGCLPIRETHPGPGVTFVLLR